MHFVFRKADNVLLYQTHTAQQESNEWAACLANEGGVAGDYIRIEAAIDIPAGYIATPERRTGHRDRRRRPTLSGTADA